MGHPHGGPTRLGSKGEEAAGARLWTSLPYTPCGRCRAQRRCPGRERQSTRRQAGKRLGGTDMLSVLISGYTGGRACQRSRPAQPANRTASRRARRAASAKEKGPVPSFATRHGGNMASGPSAFPSLLPQDRDQPHLRAPPPRLRAPRLPR